MFTQQLVRGQALFGHDLHGEIALIPLGAQQIELAVHVPVAQIEMSVAHAPLHVAIGLVHILAVVGAVRQMPVHPQRVGIARPEQHLARVIRTKVAVSLQAETHPRLRGVFGSPR